MPGFPFFKQLDSMDCGPSCLRMISNYYGKSYSIQSLRNKAFITKSGVSMLGISEAAESIGFRTRGYRITWEQLRDEVPLLCIVHWNQRHFVVVYKVKKRGAGSKGQSKSVRHLGWQEVCTDTYKLPIKLLTGLFMMHTELNSVENL